MATREVTIDDVPQGLFKKLSELTPADGTSYKGIYRGHAPSTGQYPGTDYTFQNRDSSQYTVSVKAGSLLEKMLAKAAPVNGELVTITRVREQDTGKANPMIVYKIGVDAGPANSPKAPAAPPPKNDW
jgi:hypothetical protein